MAFDVNTLTTEEMSALEASLGVHNQRIRDTNSRRPPGSAILAESTIDEHGQKLYVDFLAQLVNNMNSDTERKWVDAFRVMDADSKAAIRAELLK